MVSHHYLDGAKLSVPFFSLGIIAQPVIRLCVIHRSLESTVQVLRLVEALSARIIGEPVHRRLPTKFARERGTLRLGWGTDRTRVRKRTGNQPTSVNRIDGHIRVGQLRRGLTDLLVIWPVQVKICALVKRQADGEPV